MQMLTRGSPCASFLLSAATAPLAELLPDVDACDEVSARAATAAASVLGPEVLTQRCRAGKAEAKFVEAV